MTGSRRKRADVGHRACGCGACTQRYDAQRPKSIRFLSGPGGFARGGAPCAVSNRGSGGSTRDLPPGRFFLPFLDGTRNGAAGGSACLSEQTGTPARESVSLLDQARRGLPRPLRGPAMTGSRRKRAAGADRAAGILKTGETTQKSSLSAAFLYPYSFLSRSRISVSSFSSAMGSCAFSSYSPSSSSSFFIAQARR